MARRNDRDDGSIDNRETLCSVYQELVAHAATSVLGHHGARAGRMRECGRQRGLSKKCRVDILIRGVLSTRDQLADLVLLELRTGPDSAEESETNGHDAPVNGVDECVVDDIRRSGGVLGINVNESTG